MNYVHIYIHPDSNDSPVEICTPQGFMLHFTFIQGNRTVSDLGKTKVFLT